MSLVDPSLIASFACAGIFGFSACLALVELDAAARWRRMLKTGLTGTEEGEVFLSEGLAAWLLGLALKQSLQLASLAPQSRTTRLRKGADEALGQKMRLAGLAGRLTREGCHQTRIVACASFAGVGCICGVLVSPQLACVGLACGALFGWRSILWALGREAQARKRSMEAHLSQALEVLCLGLRSGLSFDYALRLYCQYFPGVLSLELERAQGEWASGLKQREAALRDVADGYDSVVLQRAVESIVRTMRFGSPLAPELESLAAEARQRHKSDVEEMVMKAPVKMMLPVGTLILPSMLILVLGPVLLGLVDGF